MNLNLRFDKIHIRSGVDGRLNISASKDTEEMHTFLEPELLVDRYGYRYLIDALYSLENALQKKLNTNSDEPNS